MKIHITNLKIIKLRNKHNKRNMHNILIYIETSLGALILERNLQFSVQIRTITHTVL